MLLEFVISPTGAGPEAGRSWGDSSLAAYGMLTVIVPHFDSVWLLGLEVGDYVFDIKTRRMLYVRALPVFDCPRDRITAYSLATVLLQTDADGSSSNWYVRGNGTGLNQRPLLWPVVSVTRLRAYLTGDGLLRRRASQETRPPQETRLRQLRRIDIVEG